MARDQALRLISRGSYPPVEASSRREVWFFYGVRNRSEHIMKEHLEGMALENKNICFNVCYSNPRDEDLLGRDYHHGERVSVDLFKRLLHSNNYDFYISGPRPMMNQIIQDLKEWGVAEENIHFEVFGSATVKKVAPPRAQLLPSEKAVGIQVTFAKSGKTCCGEPGIGSLLELAEKHGVRIDFGCRAGNCGTCLTAVKGGEVEYLVKHGAVPESGSCLTCITVPKADVILDA